MSSNIEKAMWNGAAISELLTLGAYSHDLLDVETASKITMGIGAAVVGFYVIDTFDNLIKKSFNDIKRYI